MGDLTTTEAVKAYAGVKGTGDDARIAGVVSAVSAMLSDIVGHDYDGGTIVAEKHTAPMSGAVVLDSPAASIDAIREGTGTVAASDYELEGERLVWRLSADQVTSWAKGARYIEVDYTLVSTIPVDLELAARESSAFMVKQSAFVAGGSRLGLSAQANGDTGSADYFAQQLKALPFTSLALRRYRRF